MNYAVYLRKITNTQSKIIGYQNGQDASQVTYKNMARAQSVPQAVPVATSFSRIDGRVSILDANNSSPTSQPYSGVSNGIQNADTAANLLGKQTHCAVCSDPPSSEPYQTIVPCKIFINPVAYNYDSGTVDPTKPTPGTKPAAIKCSWENDTSQVFRDNSELVADQGRQLALRSSYNLPAKLQGLRGPVVGR
jgi:hypothetical protein